MFLRTDETKSSQINTSNSEGTPGTSQTQAILAIDVALALYERGLSVIPVPRPRYGVKDGQPGDGKVPAIAWRVEQTPEGLRRKPEHVVRSLIPRPPALLDDDNHESHG